MANTLLGYFKYHLKNSGCSTKYFNRDFLGTFIVDYRTSHKTGIADYTETAKTKFYQINGGSYCRFLELYEEYRRGMDTYNALAAIFNIKH